ncbi:MAG: formylmethanofuran dehydrogenase subunit A, partial [Pseudomonadota bacterium]
SAAVETVIDACDMVVMAGAIDIHTHVVGANINAAKRLLPERYGNVEAPPTEWTGAPFDLFSTGALYAQMGYTLVVEPAVAPTDAVATHAELELIPYVDRAALCVVGNDDTTLRLLRERASPQTLQDYVAWLLTQTKCIGAKTINPGGVAALKANVRSFDLDDEVPEYGVSSRRITAALRQALATLGVPHPLHLHTHNLGLPGSVDTALATIQSAEAQPMHLAHLQFYGYGKDGSFGMSSGAGQLAEMLAANPQVTADVGQVVFGPTVTVSSDVLTQFHGRSWATPKKWMVRDGDGNGGGVVPYHYKAKNRIAALQWAIGLELFLLIDNPAQIFLTTDHPNGGPFTAYPDIIASLMSVDHRQAQIDRLPKEALETSTLSGIKREYSLSEVATMTRAAPARLLGLADRGHLKVGAVADIAIYPRDANPAKMFANATHVLKNGDAIVKDGKLQPARYGATLAVAPEYDPAIVRHIADDYDSRFSAPPETFTVPDRLLRSTTPFQAVACRPA